MTKRYPDEKYASAKEKLQEREKLISRIAEISRHIDLLTKIREETRTSARKLKSAAIAYDLGVSQCWVEKISEGKIVR